MRRIILSTIALLFAVVMSAQNLYVGYTLQGYV